VGVLGILVESATGASGKRPRLHLILPLLMGIIASIAVWMLPRLLLLLPLTLRVSRTTGGIMLRLSWLLMLSSPEESIVIAEFCVESPFPRLLLLVRLLRMRIPPPLHLLHLHDDVRVVVVLHPADVAHAVLALARGR
jgi:hypothetical protein